MKVRYSEIFYSFQGEAEMTGQPSVWIRLFGCNLNCSGFGQTNPTDPSTYALPYLNFDPTTVTSVEELPVWNKGCDSSYSWSQKFRHLAKQEYVARIAELLIEQNKHKSNPNGLFVHPITKQKVMLSFTGGEPMLQQNAIDAILNELGFTQNFPKIINIETNATQELRNTFISDTIYHMVRRNNQARFHFSMSPKLYTVTGEKDAVDYDNIVEYSEVASSAVLKFVCNGTDECWDELDEHIFQLQIRFARTAKPMPPIWIMPVGATKDDQEQQWVADLAIEAMKRGYNVASRLQCYVFGNVIGR